VITRGEDKLKKHCNRAHHKYNFGFMQYGFLPLIDQWCYKNFLDYLADPEVELIEKDNKETLTGRPSAKRQNIHHTPIEQMHYEQAEPQDLGGSSLVGPEAKEVEQIQPRKHRVNNNTIVNLQPVHVDSVVNIGNV